MALFGKLALRILMEVTNISLVEADTFCDYIPFVSSITNLIDLVIKTICSLVENYNAKDFTIDHHYFSYLHNEKRAWRCAVLLMPIFGNLYILMHPEKVGAFQVEVLY